MRNLTIKREKSFVASLATMQIYLESPQGDTNINGTMCMKVGKLKNGGEFSCQIPDEACRVYVIGDKLSKSFCSEYFRIPAGTEDVYLTGRNRYDLARSHAFCFDGQDDPEVLASRNKGRKKGIIILVCAFIIGLVIGFVAVNWESPKDFSKNGVTITLTSDFEEEKVAGMDATFASDDVAVYCLRESFRTLDIAFAGENSAQWTVEEYAQLVMELDQHDSQIKTEDGITYFTYVADVDGEDFSYFVTAHKAGDAFWLVQFCTPEDKADKLEDDFLKWAKTVKFDT